MINTIPIGSYEVDLLSAVIGLAIGMIIMILLNLAAGKKPKKTIFANPVKLTEEIHTSLKQAAENNIKLNKLFKEAEDMKENDN